MFKNTANPPKLQIFLANPRGFCAGVERAVEIVERTILKYGAPVYVRHEIVHNKYVVEGLRAKGAIFVEEISEIPENAVTIFSAHGVSEKVENKSKYKNLKIIDATCPLVKKVHLQAQKFEKEGDKVILIGHKNHAEVEGTSGRVKQDVFIVENISDIDNIPYEVGSKISYITQTTLSVDDTKNIINKLKSKFPNIKGPELNNICYATQNRQDAVKKLAIIADTVFVIGAKNSSNSNRLRDIAENFGVKAYLLNGDNDEISNLLINTKILGITAGASAPEILIENLINKIRKIRDIEITNLKGIEENIKFKIPRGL
ncbi:MAG: 4-hydroxy-3-methylbut-2-enyl diphosphate reductase [Candidatus Midichloriaceae bacterium]